MDIVFIFLFAAGLLLIGTVLFDALRTMVSVGSGFATASSFRREATGGRTTRPKRSQRPRRPERDGARRAPERDFNDERTR